VPELRERGLLVLLLVALAAPAVLAAGLRVFFLAMVGFLAALALAAPPRALG
jgi:hypothetical protein